MIEKLTRIFLVLFSIFCWAQQPIDIPQIQAQAKDAASPFYYPKLLKRWQARDSSLNSQECTALYYGQNSSNSLPKDMFLPLKNLAQKAKLSPEELKKAMQDCDAYLEKEAFDLEMLEYQIHFLHLYGVAELRKRTMVLHGKMLQAVLASGRGVNCEEALLVRKVQDIDYWLSVLDFEMDSQTSANNCHQIELKANKNNRKQFYIKPF